MKHTRMSSLNLFLRGCYLLSLLRSMLLRSGDLSSPLMALFSNAAILTPDYAHFCEQFICLSILITEPETCHIMYKYTLEKLIKCTFYLKL